MNLSIVLRYIKKTYGEVTALSKQTGYSRFYHLFDYLSALVRHGAHIDQYIAGSFWRYSNPERSMCLTHYRRIPLLKKYNNKEDIHYFKNKPDFNRFFSDFVHRGWLWLKEASFDDFKAFLIQYRSVIVKPIDGCKGNGIRKLEYTDQDDDTLRQLFDALVKENVIIEEIIVQHPDMVFGNKSVNTIRVLTACRPNGEACIMKAFLRAGVGETLVDNTAAGGYYYEVDLPTGVVSSQGISKYGDLVIIHPQTDIIMLGYKIPLWDQVKETCIEAAKRLPRIALVGWDVAISSNGVQMIEGNHSPDYIGYEYIGSNGYYKKIKDFLEN